MATLAVVGDQEMKSSLQVAGGNEPWWKVLMFYLFIYLFIYLFSIFRAAPAAYGGSKLGVGLEL